MNDQRNDDQLIATTEEAAQPPRILARRMARELTIDELDDVSGGMRSAGGYTATSVCCDCDACDL